LNQQGRRLPFFIFERLTATRRLRVSGFLVALTHRTHSQRASQVRRHARLGPVFGRRHLDRDRIAGAGGGGPLQAAVDAHPMTGGSIGLQHRLKRVPVERSADRHLTTRRQGFARRLRELEDGPDGAA